VSAGTSVTEVSDSLARHETFGHAKSIRRRAAEVLDFTLDILTDPGCAPELSSAAAAGAQRIRSQALVFDPVVRDALENGLRELKAGRLGPASAVFAALERIGAQHGAGTLEEASLPLLYLADGLHGVQLWDPAVIAPGATSRFAELCVDQLQNREGIQAEAVAGSAQEAELLLSAAALAGDLLGTLATDLFSHVRVVVLVAGQSVFRSASDRGAPGAVFLRLVPGDQPLTVAELLVHESVHHRLYDLYASRSILAAGYQERSSEPIVAHWNQPSAFDTNLWSPDRALAAFHVYVHLAVLFTRACEEGTPRPRNAAARARQSCERARYLGEQLRGRSGDLGPDGLRLVEWLLGELARVEKAHPTTATTVL
jgi:HEXXH motif-containing protein